MTRLPRRNINLTPAMLVSLLQGGDPFRVTQNALPKDAHVIDVQAANGYLLLTVESAEFTDDTPQPLEAPVIQRVKLAPPKPQAGKVG